MLMVAEWPDLGSARVLIDPLAIDGSAATTLDLWRPSWTGRLVAFQLSRGGDESPQLRVLDVGSGREVGRAVSPGRPTPVAWLPDDSGYYYVHGSATETTRQVRIHLLNDDATADAVVFETPLRQLAVMISPDGRWLVISCAPGAQRGNRVYLADLTDPSAPAELRLVYDGTIDDTQSLIKFGPHNSMYAITTGDAPGGRICRIHPERPTYDAWRTIITPRSGDVLTGCTALVEPRDGELRFLVSATAQGHPRLTLHKAYGERLATLPVPGVGPATLTNLSSAPGEPSHASFLYASFTTPAGVYRFDLADRRIHRDSVAGDVSPLDDIATVRHVSYTSDDGTEVPLYLVLPTGDPDRDRVPRRPRPAILAAYGGFGVSAAATYSPSLLAWVKAGGIYAIAGVRGGAEHGTAWHEAGRRRNKPNAFADFGAAARWLHAQGWTTPDQLAIRGASHSGLMVAVAVTRDPQLYAAAVCSDAVTDMIRYPHLGLGAWWIDEFGDPTNDDDRQTLLGYSPYHNTRPGTAYPAVLLTTPLHDPRVGAAHTHKLTAELQHAASSTKPILLRTESDVGHGPRAASRLVNLHADTLAFCAAHTGLR